MKRYAISFCLLISAFCFSEGQTTHNLEIIFQRGIPDTSLRYWGAAIAGVGDVNGDGYDDVAISAYIPNTWNPKVYVFFGSPSGIDTVPDLLIEPPVDQVSSMAIAGGDINKDGYNDICIGMQCSIKKVWVYYGGNPMVNTPEHSFGWLNQPNFINMFGSAACGDLNGDDTTDLIVGDYWNTSGEGHVYIYRGSAQFDTIPWLEIRGHDFEKLGHELDAGGDVNKDGYSDLIIGANGYNPDERGRIYLFLGGNPMDTIPDWWKDGEGAGQYWGEMPSAICTFNNDYSRIWAGSMYYPGGYGTSRQNGKGELFYGGALLDSIPDMFIIGADSFSNYGSAFSSALFDSNGYGDLICGATEPTGSGLGRCWSSKLAQDTTVNAWLMGRWNDDRLGVTCANAGDVDSDAIEEVIFGSWADTNRLVVICKYTGPNGVEAQNASGEIPIVKIFPNAPNPFKQITTIRYQLTIPGKISLKIYNMTGQLVRTLADEYTKAGTHAVRWDGKDELGRVSFSGVYFYCLSIGERKFTKRMMMIK